MLPSRARCGSGAFPSASSSGRLHHSSGGFVCPRCCASSCAVLAPARLSKCHALSLCFRVMPKPPSLPFLCPVASAQLPLLISLPDHRHLHWIFSFWREEFSLRQGCWLQTRFLICFSLTPFPSPRLVHVGRLKTFWLRHEPCTGFALRGCSDQGGSPKIIPL